MRSEAKTVQQYLEELPEERKAAFNKLRDIIIKNLPKGFEEEMGYGMLGYVVPHTLYPGGYHCDPKQPLPFMGLASQKHFIAFYHMGIYANKPLFDWYIKEYSKIAKHKVDIGKSCTRFKYFDEIPYELIGELVKKMTPQDWIDVYSKMDPRNR